MFTLLAVILFVYLFIAGYIYCFQDKLVYDPNYPTRKLTSTPAKFNMAFDSVILTTTDQVKIHGWYVPCKGAKQVALLCHGNSGNMSCRLDSVKIFHDLGLSVFIFDYRGYGESEGYPSEEGTYRDVEAAWKFLAEEKSFGPKNIVVSGRSLGGSIASYISHKHHPRGLIIDSSFASIFKLGKSMFPIFPAKILVRYKYPNEYYVANTDCPILILHSVQDETIPYSHGLALFKAAKEPKRLISLQGGHNNSLLLCEETYRTSIQQFLESLNANN